MEAAAPPPDDASPAGPEAVLATFERLVASKVPLVVETEDGIESDALATALEPARGRVVVDIPRAPLRGLDADDEVDLFFILGGVRWVTRTAVHHHSENRTRFSLLLPGTVEPADRRREPRVCLDPSDRIWARLVPGEPGHLSLRGRLANLSEGGCRVAVEEALDTRDGQSLDPQALGLQQGQVVDLLEIEGLRPELLDTQARIMDLMEGPLGPVLGLRFKYLRAEDRGFLRSFVAARAAMPPPHPVLPVAPRTPETEGEEARRDRTGSLLRLKKRLRTLLLAMPPGPERDRVERFLRQEGYEHMILAATLAEVTEALRSGPVHLAYVDGGVQEMGGPDLATFLHFARDEQACPVLLVAPGLAEAVPGVARHLPARVLGPPLAEALEDLLGLRPPSSAPAQPGASPDARLKRFKTLAILMPEGPERSEFLAFLGREGFTRVHPAGTVMEWARLLRGSTPDLCFIDWPGPGAMELDLLHFLAAFPFAAPPRLVMAQEQVTSQMAREATRLGVARLLLKPYAQDAAFVKGLLEVLAD